MLTDWIIAWGITVRIYYVHLIIFFMMYVSLIYYNCCPLKLLGKLLDLIN